MALYPFVEEAAASAEVRAVYEDIKATRKVDWINNFWKVLANHPASLRQTWESLKAIMAPGAHSWKQRRGQASSDAEAPGEKLAALPQPFLIDAVPHPVG